MLKIQSEELLLLTKIKNYNEIEVKYDLSLKIYFSFKFE
jgi:hypothetical protein